MCGADDTWSLDDAKRRGMYVCMHICTCMDVGRVTERRDSDSDSEGRTTGDAEARWGRYDGSARGYTWYLPDYGFPSIHTHIFIHTYIYIYILLVIHFYAFVPAYGHDSREELLFAYRDECASV